MRVALVQALGVCAVAVDPDARDAAQLPRAADAVGRAAGLVAEAHVVGVLVVEGDPLRLAGAGDVGKGRGGGVAVDAGEDGAGWGEACFLVEGGA